MRVIVDANRVSDDSAMRIAREVAKKIEADMTYPGEIKVTLLRECGPDRSLQGGVIDGDRYHGRPIELTPVRSWRCGRRLGGGAARGRFGGLAAGHRGQGDAEQQPSETTHRLWR